jgi:hypothetical protein
MPQLLRGGAARKDTQGKAFFPHALLAHACHRALVGALAHTGCHLAVLTLRTVPCDRCDTVLSHRAPLHPSIHVDGWPRFSCPLCLAQTLLIGCAHQRVMVVCLRESQPFVMRKTAMIDTPVPPCPCPAHTAQSSLTIHTTLYDLIAALSAEVKPDAAAVMTAAASISCRRTGSPVPTTRNTTGWSGTGLSARHGPGSAMRRDPDRRSDSVRAGERGILSLEVSVWHVDGRQH